jgi:hypothetical protein
VSRRGSASSACTDAWSAFTDSVSDAVELGHGEDSVAPDARRGTAAPRRGPPGFVSCRRCRDAEVQVGVRPGSWLFDRWRTRRSIPGTSQAPWRCRLTRASFGTRVPGRPARGPRCAPSRHHHPSHPPRRGCRARNPPLSTSRCPPRLVPAPRPVRRPAHRGARAAAGTSIVTIRSSAWAGRWGSSRDGGTPEPHAAQRRSGLQSPAISARGDHLRRILVARFEGPVAARPTIATHLAAHYADAGKKDGAGWTP